MAIDGTSSKPPPYRDFVCGWGAALIEMSLTFPLNKLIFRQQLHNITVKQAVSQIRSEGPRFLYRGILPPLCQKAASRSIMFGIFDQLCLAVGCPKGVGSNFGGCHALCALLAGTAEAALVPFERVQGLMQCQRYHNHFKNTAHAFVQVGKYGFKEYYRGLSAVLMRNGPSNVLFFGLRQPIHDNFLRFSDRLSHHHLGRASSVAEFLSHFAAGAILGASISTIAFPLNVIKSNMQTQLGGPFQSPLTVFKLVLAQRGHRWTKLFTGVRLNYTRSLLTWGLTNSLYELLKKLMFDDR